MKNKTKILSNDLDQAPKTWERYKNELNNPEFRNQIIEAFDKDEEREIEKFSEPVREVFKLLNSAIDLMKHKWLKKDIENVKKTQRRMVGDFKRKYKNRDEILLENPKIKEIRFGHLFTENSRRWFTFDGLSAEGVNIMFDMFNWWGENYISRLVGKFVYREEISAQINKLEGVTMFKNTTLSGENVMLITFSSEFLDNMLNVA